jgi:hypothetical protein
MRLLALLLFSAALFGQVPGDTLLSRLAAARSIRQEVLDQIPGAVEETRLPHAIRFRKPDGSIRHIFREHINWDDDGQFVPNEPVLWTTDRGWLVVGSPVKTRIAHNVLPQDTDDLGIYFKAADVWYSFTLVVPTLTHDGGMQFSYTDELPWTITVDNGYELTAPVAASRGVKLYSWPYRASASLGESVDAAGNLVGAGGFRMGRAVMVRADGVTTPCSAWDIAAVTSRVRFTCDDRSFPPEAFPYVIDPTSAFNIAAGANDGQVGGYVTSLDAAQPINNNYQNTNDYYAHATLNPGSLYVSQPIFTWDTSSLPDGAVVTGGTFEAYGYLATSSATAYIKATWYCCTITNAAAYVPPGSQGNVLNGPQLTGSMPAGRRAWGLTDFSGVNKTGWSGLRFYVWGSGGAPSTNGSYSFYMTDYWPGNATYQGTLSLDYILGGPKLIIGSEN